MKSRLGASASPPSVNAIFTCIGAVSVLLVVCARMLIKPLSPKLAD